MGIYLLRFIVNFEHDKFYHIISEMYIIKIFRFF